ncbi:hypothetical protein JCM3775_005435 [Rhodotorula graminis]
MDPPQPEPCVVCGEPTSTRCSSCSRAGIDLFYCSVAHQQLVWKAHRAHCGPSAAHPFVASPIDRDELPFILSATRREIPVATFAQKGFVLPASLSSECARKGQVSLERAFSTRSGIPAKQFRKMAVDGLTTSQRGANFADDDVQAWLRELRHYAWTFFDLAPSPASSPSPTPPPAEPARVHALPLTTLAATLEMAIRPMLDPGQPLLPLVDSSFKHRALLVAAVLQADPPVPHLVPKALKTLLVFLTPYYTVSSLLDTTARLGELAVIVAPVQPVSLGVVSGLGGRVVGFFCRATS